MLESGHARSCLSRAWRGCPRCPWALCPDAREALMFEPILGLVVALGLAVYLVATLMAPERF
ncbi:MAG: K(+)-transporting ATPase subunit F [Devosia sp.]